MTSEQRIIRVLNGKLPDRVPIHFGFNSYMGGMREVIYKHESFKETLKYMDEHVDIIVQMSPKFAGGLGLFLTATEDVEKEVFKIRENNSTYITTVIHTPKGDLRKVERVDDGVATVWHVEHVIKEDRDIDKFLSIPYVAPVPNMSDIIKKSKQISDKGMVFISLLDPIREVNELMSFEEFMIRCLNDRNQIFTLMDVMNQRICDIQKQILEKGVSPVIVLNGIEFATPPYVKKSLLHEFLSRYYISLIDMIHEYGCFAYIHSHGRVGTILDEIKAIGADALHPVEAPPGGDISLGNAKMTLDDRVAISGNIQFGDLEMLDRDEVESIVKEAVLTGKEGGRFILATTSSAIKAPLEKRLADNYIAAVETALKYGVY